MMREAQGEPWAQRSSAFANADIDAVLRDPLSAARQSLRPVVAFASNNVPVELINAAGCFPLQLPTAPRSNTARADRYLEACFDPTVRAALEQLLAGELECARMLVLPRTNDSWQRLYYYVCELDRSFQAHAPKPFLYDLLHMQSETSAAYNLASTQALARALQELAGTPVQDGAIARSIALYDRIRDKLGRVMTLRQALPCRLAGSDALELYAAAQRLAPEVFERALDDLLARDRTEAAAVPGVRTLLIGSAHDTPALHTLIARAGGAVVADYHWRGDLLFGPAMREHTSPLHALSDYYGEQSWSTRTFPASLDRLLRMAARCHAEAAIFFYYAEEEALTWDYPEQRAALQAEGLPTLLLAAQAYPPSHAIEHDLRRFFAELAA